MVRAAELFRKHGQKFLINSSFTKRNQDDIANTFKVAKSLGATAWYMFMIVPTGRGEEIMSELISKEDYEEILDWHYQQEKLEDDILMRPTCAPHYYRIVPQKAKAEGVKFERRSLTFSTGGGKGCIAAQTICLIDCFGNVKPCSYFHRTAGNVKTDTVPGDLGEFARSSRTCATSRRTRESAASANSSTSAAAAGRGPMRCTGITWQKNRSAITSRYAFRRRRRERGSFRHLGAVLESPLVRRSAATPPRELLRVHQPDAKYRVPGFQSKSNKFPEEGLHEYTFSRRLLGQAG